MFIENNHVRTAVATIGGPTRASNLLGVSNASIHAWIKGRRVPNIDTARQLAELSKIAVERLRPV